MLVKNRVKKYQEFQKVINEGEVLRGNTVVLYHLGNSLGYSRIGISVPKKSGDAVVRNKIKRQIRAICAQVTNYSKSVDIILIVRRKYQIDNFESTKAEIAELFNKIG